MGRLGPVLATLFIVVILFASLNTGVTARGLQSCPLRCTDAFDPEQLICQITVSSQDYQALCDTVISGARHEAQSRVNVCYWTQRHVDAYRESGSRCMGGGGLGRK